MSNLIYNFFTFSSFQFTLQDTVNAYRDNPPAYRNVFLTAKPSLLLTSKNSNIVEMVQY